MLIKYNFLLITSRLVILMLLLIYKIVRYLKLNHIEMNAFFSTPKFIKDITDLSEKVLKSQLKL